MKIGLVTWYKYENFGTVLQAFALQKSIQELGHSCEIIPYDQIKQGKESKLTIEELGYKVKRKIKKILKIYEYKHIKSFEEEYNKRSLVFKEFVETQLCLSKALNFEEYEHKYDLFICGSDQIWSPAVFDCFYFLDFVKDKRKTIAYAPSIGRNNICSHYKADYTRLINGINYLSIREKRGAEVIKYLTGRDAKIVLDPTLLLDSSVWYGLIEKKVYMTPYILCYVLGDISSVYKFIKKIQKKLKCKIVIIANKITDWRYKNDCITVVSPQHFLSLFYHASMVCTDSFHGIAFSINFQKQFFSFLRFKEKDEKSQNSRVINILDIFNLKSRLIHNTTELMNQMNTDINYSDVEQILKEKRAASLRFLQNSIKGVQDIQ